MLCPSLRNVGIPAFCAIWSTEVPFFGSSRGRFWDDCGSARIANRRATTKSRDVPDRNLRKVPSAIIPYPVYTLRRRTWRGAASPRRICPCVGANRASLAVQRHLGARIDHESDAEYSCTSTPPPSSRRREDRSRWISSIAGMLRATHRRMHSSIPSICYLRVCKV